MKTEQKKRKQRTDYFDRSDFCRICEREFLYSAVMQKYHCEVKGKHFWRMPFFCPEHQQIYENFEHHRRRMNSSIDGYFHQKVSLDEAFRAAVTYFDCIEHKTMLSMKPAAGKSADLQQSASSQQRVYIKQAMQHNSKDEMMLHFSRCQRPGDLE